MFNSLLRFAILDVGGPEPLGDNEHIHPSEEEEEEEEAGDDLCEELEQLALVNHVGSLHGDTDGHMQHAENDGQLHLDRVCEGKHVDLGNTPCRIQTKGISAFWSLTIKLPTLFFIYIGVIIRVCLYWIINQVARSPEVHLKCEEVVVNHAGVCRHDSHQSQQVSVCANGFSDFVLLQRRPGKDQKQTE